ncbi:uncharacterized protein Z520_08875 [Fonsecaea multimorphosa CBS 102226]|uniref:Uncharacterized protein n=1 Tax=Fonsecaea multimorphosa CBS 102226 TaxID=1442371 RepID=A0A0D2KFA1_9EURO|nr:uncharacterized protein Z520_08875 [Fonsecaea multimorphosa CBS 102226]KIX95358.1 hypothetical protein Z520_08875 [Fonsecaea multimorphosa CBS 102226]OAL21027.1 hypothetical protein AYO22_08311 [Fonsecaea multimorphosa]
MTSTSHSTTPTNETPARPKTVDGQEAFRNGPHVQSDTPQALAEVGFVPLLDNQGVEILLAPFHPPFQKPLLILILGNHQYSEYLGRCIAVADSEAATAEQQQQQEQQTGKKRKWACAHKKS